MHGDASEQRIGASQRIAALGEMTGGVAHDFRNILAVIDAALRLAERNIDDPVAVRRFIAGAREGVDRGVGLTSQLLAFAGQQELEARPADVNALLQGLEPFLKYAAGSRTRVALALEAGLPVCHVDPAQFSAAILNLVINARDAMSGGGEIRVGTDRRTVETSDDGASPSSGRYVRVFVADQGPGMPADVLERIFDPLFTTKGDKGTGLGLPHVSAVMHLMGGHIGVHSVPGEGTVVELLFRTDEDG